MKTKKAAGDGHQITLGLNNVITNDPCAICGARCDPDGYDYFLEGTVGLVCDGCAEKYAPDLVEIRKYINRELAQTWAEGEREGRMKAGRMILEAIQETPIDRVRRVCRDKLGVSRIDNDFVPEAEELENI